MIEAPAPPRGLKKDALSFSEVVAQSVANIAPSATPALIIPLVFASAGNGTWLAYAIATAAMLFMAAQINAFAKRSASPGALSTFAALGLGPRWGAFCGWSLFLAYVFTASACLAGFTNYAGVVLDMVFRARVGTGAGLALMSGTLLLCWWIARQDVQLSARFMLLMEFAAVGLIVVLAGLFFLRAGRLGDAAQASARGMTPQGLRMALVLALFSFVGFESATALGEEARDPLRSIPRSVFFSVLLVGVFFTGCAYTLTLAFRGAGMALDKSNSPLVDLARIAGLPGFGLPLAVGALVGQFACALASVTAAARVMYSMSRDGFFPAAAGSVHETHATPHVAVAACAAAAGVAPLALLARGTAVMDVFGYLGSLATFGFLLSYALVAVAAPLYLRGRGELGAKGIASAGLALLFLAVPIVGSVYPAPDAPYNCLPYVFLALMAAGAARIFRLEARPAAEAADS
ncbi:MAG TPA: APC family permease [Elusimicrobiota bacterium]|jgi:amino acid transporter|nr:APC family permease [Elusimicrobiota bacterium]